VIELYEHHTSRNYGGTSVITNSCTNDSDCNYCVVGRCSPNNKCRAGHMTWVTSRIGAAVAGKSGHAPEAEFHFVGEFDEVITPLEYMNHLQDLINRGSVVVNQSFDARDTGKDIWDYDGYDYWEDYILSQNLNVVMTRAAGNIVQSNSCPGDENPTVGCQGLNSLCVGSNSASGTIRDFSDDDMSCNSRWKNPALESGAFTGDVKEMERPDLTSEGWQAWAADPTTARDWQRMGLNSTSFSAPTVAGMAALSLHSCGWERRDVLAAYFKAGAYVNTTRPGHKLETKSSLVYPTPGRSEDSVAGAGIVYARPILCSPSFPGGAPSPVDPNLPGDPGGDPGQGTGPNGDTPGTPLGGIPEPAVPDETIVDQDVHQNPSEPAPSWMFGEAANEDSRATQDEWGQLPSALQADSSKDRSGEGMKLPANNESNQADRVSGSNAERFIVADYSNILGEPRKVQTDSRIRAVAAFHSCPASGGVAAVADLRPATDYDLALCSDANQKCYGISDSWDDNREGFDVRIPSNSINDLKLWVVYYTGTFPQFDDCIREIAVVSHLWTTH